MNFIKEMSLSTATSSQTSSNVTTEPMRIRKKTQNLNRSDSTGSSSGRKFLAPTLSDPQTLRSDKYQKKKGVVPSGSGVTTPTGARTRNQILQPDHTSRPRVLRAEATTESEENEESMPSTSNAAIIGSGSKHTLPSLLSDGLNLHYHASTSPSMHGFDAHSSSQYDIGGRLSNLNNIVYSNNNNSSSTGSNIVPSTSKINTNLNTNIVHEVHDWWSDQVHYQSSEDDDDD